MRTTTRQRRGTGCARADGRTTMAYDAGLQRWLTKMALASLREANSSSSRCSCRYAEPSSVLYLAKAALFTRPAAQRHHVAARTHTPNPLASIRTAAGKSRRTEDHLRPNTGPRSALSRLLTVSWSRCWQAAMTSASAVSRAACSLPAARACVAEGVEARP